MMVILSVKSLYNQGKQVFIVVNNKDFTPHITCDRLIF
jgi:hypothetical protein